MEYLDCVIKESLRYHSPAESIGIRECKYNKNIAIHDIVIKKNTKVTISIFNNNKKEKYFDQPEEFLPDRWINQK